MTSPGISQEFSARRSFAWVMEDEAGDYLGCLYVYPSIAGERAAEVRWWWRRDRALPEAPFREALRDWFADGTWPEMTYRLQG